MGFNVGVVGCGRWGSQHIETLLKLKNQGFIEKIFACDIHPLRLKNLPETLDGVYSEWHEMIQSEELDLVSIVTPNSTHTSLGIAVLEQGLSVLVEKPIGSSLDEVRRLGDAAVESKGRLFSGYLLHHHSGFQYAKNLIQSQKLGRVKSIRYTKYSSRKKPDKADVIQNLASHAFSIIPDLLGAEQIPLFTLALLLENQKPTSLDLASQAKFHMMYRDHEHLQPIEVEIQVAWGRESVSKLTVEGTKENLRIHFQRHDSIEQGTLHSGYRWVQTLHSNPPLEQQYRNILSAPSTTEKPLATHLQTATLLEKATRLAQQWHQQNLEN